MLGVSLTAIKSIETGKLALSESLARRIAATTGADAKWLLANELEEPMPPLNFENQIPVGPQEWLHAQLLRSFGYQLEVFSKLDSEAATNIFYAYLSNFERELKKTFSEAGPAKQNHDRLKVEVNAHDPDEWQESRHKWVMRRHEATLQKLKAGPKGRPKPRPQARSSP